jgi:hypothetical protein
MNPNAMVCCARTARGGRVAERELEILHGTNKIIIDLQKKRLRFLEAQSSKWTGGKPKPQHINLKTEELQLSTFSCMLRNDGRGAQPARHQSHILPAEDMPCEQLLST